MNVLVIGGNRFLGIEVVARLIARGDRVTTLNRGMLSDPFGDRVRRITCDRTSASFDSLASTTWDAVVDLALFDRAQAVRTAHALQGRVGHYVMISSGQVYLVRTHAPSPATEADYHGEVMAEPPDAYDREQWRYGVDKREAEEAIAKSHLPATRIRIPMVHGGRDYQRRIESILWRLLDGGPILLTHPHAPCRHVYAPAVARAIVALLDRGPTHDAFNLAQNETVEARELVRLIAAQLGAKPRLIETTDAVIERAGLDPRRACAFNGRWMSALDATRAVERLDFVHEPLPAYLHATVQALLARMTESPPSMVQRPLELELASTL